MSPSTAYRLRGPIGDAVYAGVQVYTKGPGFNAPSANISDADLLGGGRDDRPADRRRDPGDGTPWLPLVDDDYLVMVRLYHRTCPVAPPPLSLSCLDAAAGCGTALEQRAVDRRGVLPGGVLSTMGVTEVLRAAGVNRYPPPDAPVHAPRYTGALFPTLDNVYDGFYRQPRPGQALRLRGKAPTARFWSFVFYDRWFNTPDFPAHRCFLTAIRHRTRRRRQLRGHPGPARSRTPQLDRHRRAHRGHLRHPLPAAPAARPSRRRGDHPRMTRITAALARQQKTRDRVVSGFSLWS